MATTAAATATTLETLSIAPPATTAATEVATATQAVTTLATIAIAVATTTTATAS